MTTERSAGWLALSLGLTLCLVSPAAAQNPPSTACDALSAIKLACTQGHGKVTRQAVLQNIKKVRVPNWILGGQFRWSTKSNDPLNAKFYIFQIQPNGSYKLVG